MSSFPLRISTPEGSLFKGMAERFLFRAANGDMAILAGHVPIMTTIRPGNCRLVLENGETRTAYAESGIVTVSKEEVTVLSDSFKWTDKDVKENGI